MTPLFIKTARCACCLLLGAGAVAARAAAPDAAPPPAEAPAPGPAVAVVELPPYLWENDTAPAWRYAAVPGMEILSRCPDDEARRFLQRQWRLESLLRLLLPENLRGRLSDPVTYVLSDRPASAAETKAVEDLLREHLDKDASGAGGVAVRFRPYQRLWDQESQVNSFVPSELDGAEPGGFTPAYLRYLLAREVPALPRWFIEGTIALYLSTDLATTPATGAEPAVLTFQPQAPGPEPGLLPLNILFSDRMLDVEGEAGRRQWQTTAVLLIRWSLDPQGLDGLAAAAAEAGRKVSGADRLWRLLKSAGGQPVTEASFIEHFDLSLAEAEAHLARYAATAAQRSFQVRPGIVAPGEPLVFRPATLAEISELQGDAARIQSELIGRFYPPLADRAYGQAREIFHRAYDAGDRSPRLLASLGLLECEAGDDAAARPFLQAAAAAGTHRPRVYYELARIEYQRLMGAYPDGRFPLGTVDDLFGRLATARKLAPAMAEVYELLVEAWLRCAARLDARQLEVMNEGIRLFPRDSRLIYSAALLSSVNQRHDLARHLIEHGLRVTINEAGRSQFLRLSTALELEAPLRHEPDGASTRRRKLDTDLTVKLKTPEKYEVTPKELNSRVTQLEPFTVREVFPSIDVNFTLSGASLFDTLQDPIEEARVSYVQGGGTGARLGIQIGDLLLNLNGTPIRGLTIRQLSELVAQGRKNGNLIWVVRRGMGTFTVRHNGKWETPLPTAP